MSAVAEHCAHPVSDWMLAPGELPDGTVILVRVVCTLCGKELTSDDIDGEGGDVETVT